MVKIMKNIRAEFHRLTMPSKMQVLKDTVFVIAAALICNTVRSKQYEHESSIGDIRSLFRRIYK